MAFTIEPPAAAQQPQAGQFTIEPPQAAAGRVASIEGPNWAVRLGIAAPESPVGQKGVIGVIEDIPQHVVEWWKKTPSAVEQMQGASAARAKAREAGTLGIATDPGAAAARGLAMGFAGGALGERAVKGPRVGARPGPESPPAAETAPPVSPEPSPAVPQPPTPEAAATVPPAGKATPKELPPVAAEGPLSQPPAITKPRQLEDQLFQLRNLETSDRLDALTAVQKLPEDYTPELDEKLYHHEENPQGVPLSAREQAIYDEHVKPIRDEASALSRDLERLSGVKLDANEVYTPRYVAGRTRSYGESIAQWMKGVEARFGGASTRTMRKTVDAQKGRDFFIAEHPETGDRTLVYVAPDRSVYAFDGTPQIKPFGKLAGSTGPKTGAIVRGAQGAYRLGQATTKEIEAQAQTRYIKSVMANRLDNLAKLRSAVRNAKYLEDLKALPEFGDYFKPAGETPIPPVDARGRTWRRPSLPQFMQYYADPRIADALDDFSRTSKDAEGLNRALQGIGRMMNAVMFINPKAHIDNVFNHMLIGRGLVGNVTQFPSVVRNLAKGVREVYTLGPEYRQALKAGLSLPYSRIVANDLHRALLTRLGKQINAHPAEWDRIARSLGYPAGVEMPRGRAAKMMLQRWAQVPNRILWASQDAMMMSRVMQLKESGIPIEKAIRTAESEIPSYRVPGQVMGSRGLAELFGNPAFGRFGRYQFGRLRAYTDMVKDAFKATGGLTSPERLHAFDQMIMLGVYTFGVYSLYDWMWQQATGNPLAYTVRSGASAIPKAVQDVTEGKKKAGDLIYSLFTLGVPIELASEAYQGRYGWSGQPIIRDADVRQAMKDPVRAKQVARDIASFFAQMFSSIGTLVSPSATETKGQTGLRALGVVSPTPEQAIRKERGQAIDERSARRRAYKQENRP